MLLVISFQRCACATVVVKGSLGQQRRASPEFLATIRRECIECGHRPLVGSGRCRILVMPHQPRRMTMETEPQTALSR